MFWREEAGGGGHEIGWQFGASVLGFALDPVAVMLKVPEQVLVLWFGSARRGLGMGPGVLTLVREARMGLVTQVCRRIGDGEFFGSPQHRPCFLFLISFAS